MIPDTLVVESSSKVYYQRLFFPNSRTVKDVMIKPGHSSRAVKISKDNHVPRLLCN
jgi:hypothetical protein